PSDSLPFPPHPCGSGHLLPRGVGLDTPTTRPWTEPGRDPELLVAAQRGQLTSLLQLVYMHRLPLWRACMAITRQGGEAERLFLETLAAATRQLRAAPSYKPFLPWLVQLARELDAARTRGRPQRTTVGARRPNGEPWGSGPTQSVEDEQQVLHG